MHNVRHVKYAFVRVKDVSLLLSLPPVEIKYPEVTMAPGLMRHKIGVYFYPIFAISVCHLPGGARKMPGYTTRTRSRIMTRFIRTGNVIEIYATGGATQSPT
jgi:hypothetical protein